VDTATHGLESVDVASGRRAIVAVVVFPFEPTALGGAACDAGDNVRDVEGEDRGVRIDVVRMQESWVVERW
jgi:hypothetical protein